MHKLNTLYVGLAIWQGYARAKEAAGDSTSAIFEPMEMVSNTANRAYSTLCSVANEQATGRIAPSDDHCLAVFQEVGRRFYEASQISWPSTSTQDSICSMLLWQEWERVNRPPEQPPQVFIEMRDGVLTGVWSEVPVKAVLVDYAVSDYDKGDFGVKFLTFPEGVAAVSEPPTEAGGEIFQSLHDVIHER